MTKPIGIMSKKMWKKRRSTELIAAIVRYDQAGFPVPEEWIDEYANLIWELYS